MPVLGSSVLLADYETVKFQVPRGFSVALLAEIIEPDATLPRMLYGIPWMATPRKGESNLPGVLRYICGWLRRHHPG